MVRPLPQVVLSEADRAWLKAWMRSGRATARVFKRARILQLLDAGHRPAFASEALDASMKLVNRVAQRYLEQGLEAALREKPRRGALRRLGPEQEERVMALVRAAPPPGHPRWTVRLLTREVLRLGIAERLGRETIRTTLARHQLRLDDPR